MISVFKPAPPPTQLEAPAPTLGQRLTAHAARGLLWVVSGLLALLVGSMLLLTLPLMVLSAPILWPMVVIVVGWLLARRRTRVDLPAYIGSLVDTLCSSGRRVWIAAGITGAVVLIGSMLSGQPASTTLQVGPAAAALVLLGMAQRGGGRRGQ